MKNKIIGSVIICSLVAGCASKPHATISKEQATATALAQVSNGTVKDSELEKEHGKWIWSFDIAVAGSPDIKEVAVDANTGKVISIETETPAQQAREAAEDKAKEKQEKHDKEDKD